MRRTKKPNIIEQNMKVDPVEQARKTLEADQMARMKACQIEVDAVLKKHGFGVQVTQPQVVLVPIQ